MTSNKRLTCTISSPQRTETHKDVVRATLPTSSGIMQILPGHCEAFILLKAGDVKLEFSNDTQTTVKINDAQCHVLNETIVITE